jgi:hypothetical protein
MSWRNVRRLPVPDRPRAELLIQREDDAWQMRYVELDRADILLATWTDADMLAFGADPAKVDPA